MDLVRLGVFALPPIWTIPAFDWKADFGCRLSQGCTCVCHIVCFFLVVNKDAEDCAVHFNLLSTTCHF